jgi:molybdopterin/thiamine biosynthesis adenylyltransferase
MGTGDEFDEVTIIDGDQVALKNCSGLIIFNRVAILLLSASG